MRRRAGDNLWRVLILVILPAAAAGPVACEREERGLRVDPSAAEAVQPPRHVVLYPGPTMADPTLLSPGAASIPHGATNAFEQNAFAMAEGKRLYIAFNCKGCHAMGGGSIGPPLLDDRWIYGGAPEQIVETIVRGRPNGMPAYGGRIPEYQVWQIAAYVRSMSGQVRKDAAPARSDHMHVKEPENSKEREAQRIAPAPPDRPEALPPSVETKS